MKPTRRVHLIAQMRHAELVDEHHPGGREVFLARASTYDGAQQSSVIKSDLEYFWNLMQTAMPRNTFTVDEVDILLYGFGEPFYHWPGYLADRVRALGQMQQRTLIWALGVVKQLVSLGNTVEESARAIGLID